LAWGWGCPAGDFEIAIEDPDGVGHGVAYIVIDGKPIQDSFVPFPDDGVDRSVVVRLGRSAGSPPEGSRAHLMIPLVAMNVPSTRSQRCEILK
jgi:hypothetical protein